MQKEKGHRKFIVYTDGGSRGNPGPAAVGFVVDGREYGETIGRTTNNVAEYKAVIMALKKAKQLLTKKVSKETDVEIRTDSELVTKHMKGEYKIKDEDLKPLFIELWNLLQDFKSVTFVHVARDKNKTADALVNRALNTLV